METYSSYEISKNYEKELVISQMKKIPERKKIAHWCQMIQLVRVYVFDQFFSWINQLLMDTASKS